MPSSVWKRSPAVMPAASWSIALGWSPAGSKSDTTRNSWSLAVDVAAKSVIATA